MRIRILIGCLTTAALAMLTAGPALASWFTSSDPGESVHATLRVDGAPALAKDGWTVRWSIQVQCPAGMPITGRVILVERDPAAIPALAGEDQGITASRDLTTTNTPRCTGHRQTLTLVLAVSDTVVTDPSTGEQTTFHQPMSPAPPTRTSAAVTLRSPEATEDGGFFLQYCAAPNCASDSGPRVRIR